MAARVIFLMFSTCDIFRFGSFLFSESQDLILLFEAFMSDWFRVTTLKSLSVFFGSLSGRSLMKIIYSKGPKREP